MPSLPGNATAPTALWPALLVSTLPDIPACPPSRRPRPQAARLCSSARGRPARPPSRRCTTRAPCRGRSTPWWSSLPTPRRATPRGCSTSGCAAGEGGGGGRNLRGVVEMSAGSPFLHVWQAPGAPMACGVGCRSQPPRPAQQRRMPAPTLACLPPRRAWAWASAALAGPTRGCCWAGPTTTLATWAWRAWAPWACQVRACAARRDVCRPRIAQRGPCLAHASRMPRASCC